MGNGHDKVFGRLGTGSLGSGKAFLLSLVWVSCLLWSPNLVYSSDRSKTIKENKKGIAGKIANIDGENPLLKETKNHEQHLVNRLHEHIDDSSIGKKHSEEKETGLPKNPRFLAGPSPRENSLYSNHSCSCHSSSTTLSGPNDNEIFSSCIENSDRSNSDHGNVKSCDGRIFYLVSIHNNRTLSDALYLFRAIRDPRNIIIVHIDAKFGLEPYYNSPLHKEIEACPCGSRVEVDSVYDCKWGSWSMNLPTLWSMTKAVKEYAGKWDVFINVSGDTLPVYSVHRIAKLFGGPLRGINFVTSVACETGLVPTSIFEFPKHWHKRTHYSYQPATDLKYVDDDGVEHLDEKVDIFFGSQWVSLTPQYCEFLILQLARPDSLPSQFRDWLIDTNKLMADETFFTSMLMRFFPETIPKITNDSFLDTTNTNLSCTNPEVSMYAIRYERMDEHVPSSKGYFPTEQRYEVPATSGIEQPKAWGPYFLGTYDLNNIRLSGALYVRKVARLVDPNIYEILPVDIPQLIPTISWPSNIKISPVPDWEKRLAQYRKQTARENS